MIYKTPILETERLIMNRGNKSDYKKYINLILPN